MEEKNDGVRLDKWLWSVRLFKTRNKAQMACKNGNVIVGTKIGKSSKMVKVGDRLTLNSGGYGKKIVVKELIFRRVSAKIAEECFEVL